MVKIFKRKYMDPSSINLTSEQLECTDGYIKKAIDIYEKTDHLKTATTKDFNNIYINLSNAVCSILKSNLKFDLKVSAIENINKVKQYY